MTVIAQQQIGNTAAQVTRLGLGCAPLGDLFESIGEDRAQQTLQAAWDAGARFFDTAPFYGYGKSEHRVGHFLRQQPRREFVVSTKVGRVLRPAGDPDSFDPGIWSGGLPFEFAVDFTYGGIMRSFEDSLQRLGLPSVDLLVIHDLDFLYHRNEARVNAYLSQLFTDGWRALEELCRHRLIKGVGAGINELGMIPRFLEMVDLDFFLVAYGYNLLNQEMEAEEFPLCADRGVSVIVGAVFASGILATGAVPGSRYNYAAASPDTIAKTDRIDAVCRRHKTPLAAAALQFLLAHPLVSAIIPGALAPEQAAANAAMLERPVPPQLWAELKAEGLLPAGVPTPQDLAPL